jgi:hypothetical protein
MIGYVQDKISETLVKKGREYCRNDDAMHNFNEASEYSGKTREEIIENYRLKHIISTKDIINDLNNSEFIPSKKIVDEKYIDIINYYILEYMSIINKINNLNEIKQNKIKL